MNDDHSCLERAHYYISKDYNETAIVVTLRKGKKKYFLKDHRNSNNTKISTKTIKSVILVFLFQFLGFKIALDDIIADFFKAIQTYTNYEIVPEGASIDNHGIINFSQSIKFNNELINNTKDLKERKLDIFLPKISIPETIKNLNNDNTFFEFVTYINSFFKNQLFCSVIQTQLVTVYNEVRCMYYYNYNSNNLNCFVKNITPSVIDIIHTNLFIDKFLE